MAKAKQTTSTVPTALAQMSFLKEAPARPGTTAAVVDPIERRRLNFAASLKTQIEVVKAMMQGKAYSVLQKHYVTQRDENGKPEKKDGKTPIKCVRDLQTNIMSLLIPSSQKWAEIP